MGTPRTDLRDTLATATLENDKAFGELVQYTTSPSKPTLSIYAMPMATDMSLQNVLETDSEVTEMTFLVSRQTVIDDNAKVVIPGNVYSFSVGDVIVRSDTPNFKWAVYRVANPDGLGARFELYTKRTHVKRLK